VRFIVTDQYRRNARAASLIALSMATTSCGRGSTARTPMASDAVEAKRLIARQCPMPPAPQSASGEARAPRVFVEVAMLEASSSEPWAPSRLDWRDDPGLALARVAHVMTTSGVTTIVPWDAEATTPNGDACAGIGRSDLSITTHASANGAEPIRLDIRIEPAPPLGRPKETWQVPDHRVTQTTLLLQDQQLVMMAPTRQPNKKPSIIFLMPYVVREDGDLRRLFECKMQAARERHHPAFRSWLQWESYRPAFAGNGPTYGDGT
jgi:hypothetical protein